MALPKFDEAVEDELPILGRKLDPAAFPRGGPLLLRFFILDLDLAEVPWRLAEADTEAASFLRVGFTEEAGVTLNLLTVYGWLTLLALLALLSAEAVEILASSLKSTTLSSDFSWSESLPMWNMLSLLAGVFLKKCIMLVIWLHKAGAPFNHSRRRGCRDLHLFDEHVWRQVDKVGLHLAFAFDGDDISKGAPYAPLLHQARRRRLGDLSDWL